MAKLATLIGIDKHQDSRIRDLTGARRDATALWALFCDTWDDLDATLLVDEQATTGGIRRALQETLGSAGPDDTVILSFSGHGSHDHRLATHDTVLDNLPGTTIDMAELADHFRATKAKIVLLILDCCFSGGAPARVLEDSPIPRNFGVPLDQLSGEGRVILAASKMDEVALELPDARHGVLTKTLLDVMRAADSTVNLTGAMEQVMARVRAVAARLGQVQTPVLLGHVVGGLLLPPLRPGRRFFTAFPEATGARVSGRIEELAAFGIPPPVLTAWESRFTGGLNRLQLAAVNERRVLDGGSLLVVAPTSAGKTFIGELAATRAIVEGRKAVFLFPYRALVNEKYDQFDTLYGEQLGMRVIRCTGDFADQTGPFTRGKYDLAVLTYEMFLNLAVGTPALLNQIGLVVLDEAQFVTDPSRGITVELLLTYLLAARERGVAPQLVTLSAVIGDVNEFDAWLGCAKLVTHERPVPLTEGVMDRSGTFQFVDDEGQEQSTQLLPSGAIVQRRERPSAQDMIVPLTRQLVAQGEQVIVFRNTRGPAQGCAKYLADELGLPAATAALERLPTHDLSRASADLRLCLQGGTAFHNTNLSREERILVEQAFRDPSGQVRVLAATTTVAAGINTPASTAVLAEQEFVGEDGRPFTIAEYKNMAGRAGRLGFNERGKAIILTDTPMQREQLFRKYVQGQLEPLRSSFDPRDLDTWVVRLLAQVPRVPRTELIRMLARTYGGFLAAQRRLDWQPEMAARLEALLSQMIDLGLVEQDGDDVHLTLLGRACGRSGLSFRSARRLVDLLRRVNPVELSAERLMVLLQALPSPDTAYTPVMKRGRSEVVRQGQAVERYGVEPVRALQTGAEDEFEYYARCKRAALLWDWTHGVAMEEIERRYSTTPFQGAIGPGDVRRIADVTRLHLRSAHEIASVMFLGAGPSEEAVEGLLKQLEVGIPAEVLDLLSLPVTLARGEYLALSAAGVTTAARWWAMSIATLEAIFGRARAAQLAALRPDSATR